MLAIPNVVTHGLLALDVYNKLKAPLVKEIIRKHPKAFLLGSNGPDLLFYYEVFPWQNQELNKKVAAYGNRVHTEKINEFYRYSFALINEMADEKRREVLLAYLAGHFLHWSLDSLAHPFVFYRSGEIAGDSRYWHFRYESMLDALMLSYVKKRKLSDLKASRFVDVDKNERRIIASFYATVLHDVFQIDAKTEEIEIAIKNFKTAMKFLYDPYRIKTPLIKALEKKVSEPWALSSHVVNSDFDAEYDELNLRKEAWSNPTDENDVSHQSFIEIYDDAIALGIRILDRFEEVLEAKQEGFDDILEDRQYDTGRSHGEMKVYRSVYDH